MKVKIVYTLSLIMLLGLWSPAGETNESPTTSQQEIVLRYKSWLQNRRGLWLNAPLATEKSEAIHDFETFTKTLIDGFKKKRPELAKHNIVLHLYKESSPNAWVSSYEPGSLRKDFAFYGPKPPDPEELATAMGLKNPEKGFIELGITTGMLDLMPFIDDLAFVLGHEAMHVINGDLKGSDQFHQKDVVSRWWNHHTAELKADTGSLDLIMDDYSIERSYDVLAQLFEDHSQQDEKSYKEKVWNSLGSFASTHPHEGIRFTSLLANIRYRRPKLQSISNPKSVPAFIRQIVETYRETGELSSRSQKSLQKILTSQTALERMSYSESLFPLSISQSKTLLTDIIGQIDNQGDSPLNKISSLLTLLQGSLTPNDSKDLIEEVQSHFLSKGGDLTKVADWWQSLGEGEQHTLITELSSATRSVLTLSCIDKGLHQLGVTQREIFDKTFSTVVEETFFELLLKNQGQNLFLTTKRTQNPMVLETLRKKLTQLNSKHLASLAKSNQSKYEIYSSLGWPMIIRVYREIFELLGRISRLPSQQQLHSAFWSKIYENLQQSIIEENLQNLRFPPFNSIAVETLYDSSSEHPAAIDAGAPSYVPNWEKSPFMELQWLSLLRPEYLAPFESELTSIFSQLMANELNDHQFIPEIDRHIESAMIIDGFTHFYRMEYDAILAKIFLAQQKSLAPTSQLRFLKTWQRLRFSLQAAAPHLSTEVKKQMEVRLRSIPKNEWFTDNQPKSIIDFAVYFDFGIDLLKDLSTSEILQVAKYPYHNEKPSKRLFDSFVQILATRKSEMMENEGWFTALNALLGNSKYAPSARVRAQLVESLRMITDRHPFLPEILSKKSILELLETPQAGQLLKTFFLKSNPTLQNDRSDLLAKAKDFEQKHGFNENTSFLLAFRNEVAKELKLQPQDLALINPNDSGDLYTSLNGQGPLIRKFSGLLGLVRSETVSNQIELLKYLLSINPNIPAFLDPLNRQIKETGYRLPDLLVSCDNLKVTFERSNDYERTALLHSFLGGPNGVLSKPQGVAALMELVLNFIPKENQEFVAKLMSAAKKVEGRDFGLLLSYGLSQRSPSTFQSTPSIDGFLKAFLENYGVPGQKWGQFFAFSSQFSQYKKTFESFQDAANPLSYIQALELLRDSLGQEWDPNRFEVLSIKGSGTVNVAIQVLDKLTGKERILNVLREQIEKLAHHDFNRFKKLIDELNQLSPSGDLEFLLGLARSVEDSVSNEFNKAHSFAMHAKAQERYAHQVDGWTVRAIHVPELLGRALLMELAPGESAVEVKRQNFNSYRQAMTAFLKVSRYYLDGRDPLTGKLLSQHFTDADIHNGQFFIDTNKKQITLIDKGQAELLSSQDHDLAIEILRLSAQIIAPKNVVAVLSPFASTLHIDLAQHGLAEKLQSALAAPSFIDRYLRLVGLLREYGNLTKAVVNYGFEFYRSLDLAAQVDKTAEWQIKSILLMGIKKTALSIAGRAQDFLDGKTPRPLRPEDNVNAVNPPSPGRCQQALQARIYH